MKSAILSTLVLASCGVIEALPSPFTGGVRIALNNQKPADEETKDVFVPPEDWPISPDSGERHIPYDWQKGGIQNPKPKPFTPAGGKGVEPWPLTKPFYHPLSDFDHESLQLALYQEYIELDLFRYGLNRFSKEEFEKYGIDADEQFLLQYMSDQEIGHARLISNMIGPSAAKQCNYSYPFDTVQGFIDFSQKLTKWGEAGVYGFLAHLDSRSAATLLTQSITTEARQQLIFRQLEGLFPMPEWFEPGIPQSWAWTLLAPWIYTCPDDNHHLVWQNFPALNITNNPDPTNPYYTPDISTNRTALSYPGRKVELAWEKPGKKVGPDGKYVTSTTAGAPKFVAWVNQLNLTYTPLELNHDGFSGWTIQPGDYVFPPESGKSNGTDTGPQAVRIVNSTLFIAITDSDPFLTPFNLSLINPHVVAGPAVYASG